MVAYALRYGEQEVPYRSIRRIDGVASDVLGLSDRSLCNVFSLPNVCHRMSAIQLVGEQLDIFDGSLLIHPGFIDLYYYVARKALCGRRVVSHTG
jgi:hypothetical protein